MPSRLLFSDVDGTLLGADGRYAMTAAELAPGLRSIEIVLASSRTVLELSRVQRDLGIDGPVVAENGAVIAWPATSAPASSDVRETVDGRAWQIVQLGTPTDILGADVQVTAQQLGITYIDQREAEPLLLRRGSILLRPIRGQDAESLEPLAAQLRVRGLSASSGGNWLAVTGGADKGVGVRAVLEGWRQVGRTFEQVAGVGDGDNDVPLLLACRHRFVIARDDGTCHPALRAVPNVEILTSPGIAGWRALMQRLTESREW